MKSGSPVLPDFRSLPEPPDTFCIDHDFDPSSSNKPNIDVGKKSNSLTETAPSHPGKVYTLIKKRKGQQDQNHFRNPTLQYVTKSFLDLKIFKQFKTLNLQIKTCLHRWES